MRKSVEVVSRGVKIRLWSIIVLAAALLIFASLADIFPGHGERIGLRPLSRSVLIFGALAILLVGFSGLALCGKMNSLLTREELTGLFNQVYVRQRLEEEFYRSKRYHRPLSLMLIDLDSLADLNGRYGRAAGDHLLRFVGETIRETVRPSDISGRYNKAEFLILLPETTLEECRCVAERLQKKISVHPFRIDSRPETIPVSLTVGMISFPQFGQSPDELIHLAQRALEQAKKDGGSKSAAFAGS